MTQEWVCRSCGPVCSSQGLSFTHTAIAIGENIPDGFERTDGSQVLG